MGKSKNQTPQAYYINEAVKPWFTWFSPFMLFLWVPVRTHGSDVRLNPSVIFQISGLSWLDAIFVTFCLQFCWFFCFFFYMHRCKKKKRNKSAQHVITHAGVAALGAKSTVGVLIRRLIRQSLLLDETLWRLHDRLNNLITGNRIMMGFLRCGKWAQYLLFLCKLRCPTSPLKITLK